MVASVTLSTPHNGRSVTLDANSGRGFSALAQEAEDRAALVDQLQEDADAFFAVDEELTEVKIRHKIAKEELTLSAKRLGRRAWVGKGLVVVQGELFAKNDTSGEGDEHAPGDR